MVHVAQENIESQFHKNGMLDAEDHMAHAASEYIAIL